LSPFYEYVHAFFLYSFAGETVTFDNEAAMEIGCRYGYAFWAKPTPESGD
jgi:hypothetical protein